MLKVTLYLFLTIFILYSCTDNPKVSKSPDNDRSKINTRLDTSQDLINKSLEVDSNDRFEQSLILNNYLIQSTQSEDLIVVDCNTAVFISPDSNQIEEMKKEYGDDFYTGADDLLYYESEAMDYLKKRNLKILAVRNRYIKFVTKTKTIYFDTKAKASLGWTTLLFRTDSLPRIYNTIDYESEYNNYWGKSGCR